MAATLYKTLKRANKDGEYETVLSDRMDAVVCTRYTCRGNTVKLLFYGTNYEVEMDMDTFDNLVTFVANQLGES